jgi:hypothetical protein
MEHRRFHEASVQVRLPQPPPPATTPAGFLACPVALLQGLPVAQQLWQLAVYQIAFARAQADARPTLPERDLLGVWN